MTHRLGTRTIATALAAVTLGLAALAAPATASTGTATTPPRPTAGGLPSPLCRPRTAPATAHLTMLGATHTSARVTRYTFRSAAVGRTVHANVLVPPDYHSAVNRNRRYPVLLLLHGAGGNANDWVDHGVEDVMGNTPMIVVMPDGDPGGWYTDWYGTDLTSANTVAPGWETFHLRELLPWVDATFRTLADRQHRVVAGLSMGGFGAVSYAARHPDEFVAAGSFSGALDTDLFWPFAPAILTLVSTPLSMCVWGDPVTQQVTVEGHDPTELAANLGDTALFVASGNGQLGPLDAKPNPAPGLVELAMITMNHQFVDALAENDVPATTWFYGNGTHTWPYWLRDLAHFLPQAMTAVATRTTTPTTDPHHAFDYRSVEPRFALWGWTFTTDHTQPTFTDLRHVSVDGFDVTGTGMIAVTTPPDYQPGRRYRVDDAANPHNTGAVAADHDGRLRFALTLPPQPSVVSLQALRPLLRQPLRLGGTLASTAHITVHPA